MVEIVRETLRVFFHDVACGVTVTYMQLTKLILPPAKTRRGGGGKVVVGQLLLF